MATFIVPDKILTPSLVNAIDAPEPSHTLENEPKK
jgi:hypothetical protein